MNTWQFILHKLRSSVDVILLYVLESRGSSPGRQGYCMAVAADGSLHGTIGGGIMEHKFVEMSRSRLGACEINTGLFRQVHDKDASKQQSGMICSGEQTIFMYELQEHDTAHVTALVESLQVHGNGTLQLSPAGPIFSDSIPELDYYFERREGEDFLYREKTGYKHMLHIIGGGHCALALSKLARELDFYIYLYDDREGLNTFEQNGFAHVKSVLPSYTVLGDIIAGGNNVYVVIMTFGYRTDDVALRSLNNKPFRYIGVLGSRNKIAKMKNDYSTGNINPEWLELVHAPVGLKIKSQTASEIAISIAAELIAEKNRDQ